MTDDNLPKRAYRAVKQRDKLTKRLTEERTTLKALKEEMKQLRDAGVENVDHETLDNLEERANELMSRWNETEAILEEHVSIEAEADIEGAKLRSEALKHQATVAGAAIIGIAAVTRDILPLPDNPPVWLDGLLWLTYLTLLSTVCASLILMHSEAWRVEHVLRVGESPRNSRTAELAYSLSFSGLTVAVILFSVVQAAISFL